MLTAFYVTIRFVEQLQTLSRLHLHFTGFFFTMMLNVAIFTKDDELVRSDELCDVEVSRWVGWDTPLIQY